MFWNDKKNKKKLNFVTLPFVTSKNLYILNKNETRLPKQCCSVDVTKPISLENFDDFTTNFNDSFGLLTEFDIFKFNYVFLFVFCCVSSAATSCR